MKTNNTKRLFTVGAGILIATAISLMPACTPVTATRGNFVEPYQLSEIVPGTHTRSEVMRILGSPTTVAPFNEKIWYYLGQHTEKHGIFDPEIVDERVIIVTFTDSGVVESVTEREGNRVEIPISKRETPTHGNDITVMQQFLGNLGKFNPQEE